jgi:hypothetical protein
VPVGKLLRLVPRRQEAEAVGRLPLVVQTHQDAVCLTIPGFDWWLHPDQADELADDLKRSAREARELARGPRPRGA